MLTMISRLLSGLAFIAILLFLFQPVFNTPEHKLMRNLDQNLTLLQNSTLDIAAVEKPKTWHQEIIIKLKHFGNDIYKDNKHLAQQFVDKIPKRTE